MSPALNGSSALQCFERSNVVKIRNGIMFDFYPGLPHITFLYYQDIFTFILNSELVIHYTQTKEVERLNDDTPVFYTHHGIACESHA